MNLTNRWSVKCPNCGAKPGQKCIGSRGQERVSTHIERWQRKLKKARERRQ